MFSKELLSKRFDERGITFGANELTSAFVDHLSTPYTNRLIECAAWIAEAIAPLADRALDDLMRRNVGRWGAEFDGESLVRGVPR